MKRRPTAERALLGMALALAWSASAAAWETPRLRVWGGVGVQSTALGDAETWTIQVAFTGDEARVDYPSLGCSGAWTREGARYREKITAGDCIDNGLVTLHQQDGKLFVNWTVAGEKPDIAAAAVLFPSGPIA